MKIQKWKLIPWNKYISEAVGKIIILIFTLVGNILNMIFLHNKVFTIVCLTINLVILFELRIVFITGVHNHLVKMRVRNILKEFIERD